MYSKELLKGTLKPILLKLLQDQGPMYGYQIVQAVRELSADKIQIKEGSLYPLLHALHAEGILQTTSRWVDGRTRKYYTLSEKGRGAAADSVSELEDFIGTLQLILQPQSA